MRQLERDPMREWVDEHVEAFIDGELSPGDRMQFEEALAMGVGDDEVLLAQRIRIGLHALPQPVLRPQISRSVLDHVRAEVQASRRNWLLQLLDLDWAGFYRPALAMTVLLALVISAALIGRPPVEEQDISQAEVEQALAEAKWALAYISHVGKETGSSVRDEVLAPHVVQPVRHVLGSVLDEQSETELR